MDFCYRFLQGKAGASGHISSGGGGQKLIARGLKGNKEYALYRWEDGKARRITKGRTDENGNIQFLSLPEGPLFLSLDCQAVLWESDAPEENYWRACEALRRENAAHLPIQKENVAGFSEERMMEEHPTEMCDTLPDKKAEVKKEEQQKEECYTLRPPGMGEGVDTLPEIIFPGKAAALKRYFQSCPPMMPFEAPGWRFVRAPSSVPGTAYCALGYLARNGRAERIAYAIPGPPHHPPVSLPGYRYYGGYWLMIEATEET